MTFAEVCSHQGTTCHTCVITANRQQQHVNNPLLFISAFDTLLAAVDELKLDYPEAPKVLAYFIGRAIADDVMHPKFLQERKDLSNSSATEVCLALRMRLGGDVNMGLGDAAGCGDGVDAGQYAARTVEAGQHLGQGW